MTTLMSSPMDPLTRPGRDFWHGVLAAGGNTTVPRWTLDPVPGVADHVTPISRKTRGGRAQAGLRPGGAAAEPAAGRARQGARRPVRRARRGRRLRRRHGRPAAALPPVDRTRSWRALVEKTRRTESALRVYAGFPVDDLRRELALAGPAFETVFDLAGAADVSGDTVLYISFPERNGGRMLQLRYRTDVLDAACAARIAGYHLTALAQVLADPDAEHRRQSLLSADDSVAARRARRPCPRAAGPPGARAVRAAGRRYHCPSRHATGEGDRYVRLDDSRPGPAARRPGDSADRRRRSGRPGPRSTVTRFARR